MYSFSLKPTGRKADPESAPSPAAHIILAPSELQPSPSPTQEANDSIHQHRLVPLSSSQTSDQSQLQQQQQQLAASSPTSTLHAGAPASPPPPAPPTRAAASEAAMQVHNVGAYTDMRDAADWSAVVQRERAEKRQRALAAHEAAKVEERQRREAAEALSRHEMARRQAERRQLRRALKADDAMADFQNRSTQFLKNQQRLIDLSESMARAETQRKARAREEVYRTWTRSRAGTTVPPSLTCPTESSLSHVAAPFAAAITTTTTTPTTATTFTPALTSTTTAAPSMESELRQRAQRTEETYVQLSVAYRNEAQRSRAAAGILAAAAAPAPAPVSTGALERSSPMEQSGGDFTAPITTATTTSSASLAPLPFRTAPQMYSHASAEHMGRYACDIPITFIPEYFDGDQAGPHATATAAATAPGSAEVMPLPLRPAPVSAEVSAALQCAYYPWAALADAGTASAPPPPLLSRDTDLPVRRWGTVELQSSVYGYRVNPDGTLQEPCERRKEFAAELNYTTIPCDNATATSNSPESIEPFRSGKRLEVWS
ncbi:hypothetical protein NQL31_006210 [Lotmaria passim]